MQPGRFLSVCICY